ncbi:hypothetical protein (Partial), partial [Seminavis robusta]
ECPQSLLLSFFRYNILIFVLPSKTSIWSQPCDNGKNELTAKDIAFAAHSLGLMVGKPLDYLDANRVFRAGLERNCIEQNDELRRTGTNAVVSSFKKTGLYPMDYSNEGWKAAILNFSRLNELLRQQKMDAGELASTNVWLVKPIARSERAALTDADKEALQSFISKEDFLTTLDNEQHGGDFELPPLFLAASIAERLLGEYLHNPHRDANKPPEPKEDFEEAALKLIVKFVSVSPDDRVDTTCTLSDEAIARDKLRTKLSVLRFGFSIVLRKKDDRAEVNITKQSKEKFLVLEGQRRESRNLSTLTVKDILETCFDDNDDDAYQLTKKDKKKGLKKARVARKQLNESLYSKAQDEADRRRLKRNLDLVTDVLATKRPRFAIKLATILEEEGLGIEDVYDDFEDVVLKPYSDVIEVTHEDTTKAIAVTRVGTEVTAVSHQVEGTIMRVLVEMKGCNGGNKPKKARRRAAAGTKTNLGKPGRVARLFLEVGCC